MTSDGRWTYVWDAENRLITMETTAAAAAAGAPKQKLDFAYDAQGRRVRKQVSNWTSGAYAVATDLRFVYDGWNLVAELDGLANSAAVRTYVWGLDLSGRMQGAGGVGGLISVSVGGSTHFAAYDGNGNVAGLVSATAGSLTANYDYNAFGECVLSDGTIARTNPFRFSTKYTDEETGEVYYGFRYYNPSTGRWLSRDSIEEQGGVNLYGFVANEPTGYIDTDGRYAKSTDRPDAAELAREIYGPLKPKPLRIPPVPVPLPPTPDPKKDNRPDDPAQEKKKDEIHSGRIQAQGNGVEKSAMWLQRTPLTRHQGQAVLRSLVAKLTDYELSQRESAIVKASQFIEEVAQNGGTGPGAWTFLEVKYTKQPSKICDPKHTRIDIEVNRGWAFILP